MERGEFWAGVTILCHAFDCRVTSGPRSVRCNSQFGGVVNSLHLLGLAADVAGYNRSDVEVLIALAARMGILGIEEGDHIHLQPKDPG